MLHNPKQNMENSTQSVEMEIISIDNEIESLEEEIERLTAKKNRLKIEREKLKQCLEEINLEKLLPNQIFNFSVPNHFLTYIAIRRRRVFLWFVGPTGLVLADKRGCLCIRIQSNT